jgi:hypothetical protein
MPFFASRAAGAIKAFGLTVASGAGAIARDVYFRFNGLLLKANTGTPLDTVKELPPPVNLDNSSNSFTITTVNTPRASVFNPISGTYYSTYFDGSSSVDFALSTTGAAAFGTGDFTIETWIYLTASPATYAGIIDARNVPDLRNWGMGIWNTSGLKFDFLYAGARLTGTIALSVGRWYHLAVTRNSGTIRMFVNGLLDGSVVYASAIDATNTIIRTGAVIDPYYFTGYISNMRLLKGNALYTAPFDVPTSTLTSTTGTTFLAHNYPYFLDQGSNLAVTINTTPKITQFVPLTQPTAYEFYGSVYLNGSNDGLTIPYNTQLDILTGDFTIEAWIYSQSTGANQTIIGQWLQVTGQGGTGFLLNGSNILFFFGAYSESSALLTSSLAIKLNVWYHVAVTRSASTFTMFINGSSTLGATATSTATRAGLTGVPLSIGNYYASGGGLGAAGAAWYQGYISNIRIIKGSALYTSSFTLSNNLLSALSGTSLLTLQYNGSNNNNMFVDKSNVSAIVTRAGDTTQGTFSPYSGSYSVFFNGSSDYLTVPANTNFALPGDFTIEMWVYPTVAVGAYRALLATGGAGSTDQFVIGTDASIQGIWCAGVISGNSVIPDPNVWTHIAVSRSGTNVYFFLNGIQQGTTKTSSSSALSGTATVGIGYRVAQGDGLFAGYITNLRVIKGAALYTGTFAPSVKPLAVTNNTQLLVCNSPAVTLDSSINKSALTVVGTTRSSLISPFSPSTLTQNQGRYSVYLNGSSRLVTNSIAGTAFGTGTFTVECWIYMTAAQTTSHITDGTTTNNLFLKMNPTNICIGRAGVAEDSIFTYAFSTNTWYHIAFTRVGTTVTGYVNGTSIGSNTNANSYTAGGLNIGSNSANSQYFTGYISNLRYSSSAIYTSASFTPLVDPLVVETGTVYLGLQNTTQVDASKYQNITTPATGTPITVPFSPFTSSPTTVTLGTLTTPYVVGGSMYFDGTGDSLSIPDSPVYNLSTAGTWTIDCWIFSTGPSSQYRTIISKRSGGSQWQIFIQITTNYFAFFNGTQYATNIVILPNIWYHVAASYDGTNLRMFVNGVLGYTGAVNAVAGSDPIYIGGVTGSSEFFVGYITDLRVIRGRALYTANFIPPTLPVANTPETILLLRGDSAGIYDSTGGNDLQTVGAKVSTSIKKFNSGSMQFNGSTDYMVIPGNPIFSNGTADFTVDCWVYLNAMPTSDTWPTNYASTMVIVESGTFNAGDGFSCIIGTTKLLVHDNSDTSYTSPGNHGMVINTWYHLAYVRSSNTMIFYVNGSSIGSVAFSASLSTGSFTYIGCETTQGAFLNGYIDDLRFTRLARYTGPYFPLPTSSPQETGPSETEAGDAGVTYVAGDGLSSATAGISAAAIKAQTGTNADGAYWINLPTVGPTQVYCIMNSAAAGGGWMMAMKATRGTTFSYGSTHWNSVTTLNTTNNNRADGDAKFHTMNYYQATDIMALFPDITTNGGSLGVGNPFSCWSWLESNFNGSATTLINFFNTAGTYNTGTVNTAGNYGGKFIKDAKTFSGWQSGIFSSQVDIRFYGFNYKNVPGYGSFACRWGFGWNENGEGLYSTPAGLAITYGGSDDVGGGIGMDSSFGNYSAGDYIGCCQDTTGINRSARVEIYIR